MSNKYADQVYKILELAQSEAKSFNHEYVGTEHLLLALARAGGSGTDVLQTFHVQEGDVRLEIEKLVSRGPSPVTASVLPLTPRANRVLEYAREEARIMNQNPLGAEHLLLGLFREPGGVSAQVLLNLGLKLDQLRQEAMKTRLLQMKMVERAVRPVRAATARKRKMREELLAHLTAIYEEELTRGHDAPSAMNEAAARFGNPDELARDLQDALPYSERIGYRMERWFGWRAPESAARYSLRVAVQLFFLLLLGLCPIVASIVLVAGADASIWKALRPFAALLIFIPVDEFLIGVLYFKMRDALWGAFGASRSGRNAFSFLVGIGLVVFGTGIGFFALGSSQRIGEAQLLQAVAAAVVLPLFFLLMARVSGLTEISDTVWACLDLDNS